MSLTVFGSLELFGVVRQIGGGAFRYVDRLSQILDDHVDIVILLVHHRAVCRRATALPVDLQHFFLRLLDAFQRRLCLLVSGFDLIETGGDLGRVDFEAHVVSVILSYWLILDAAVRRRFDCPYALLLAITPSLVGQLDELSDRLPKRMLSAGLEGGPQLPGRRCAGGADDATPLGVENSHRGRATMNPPFRVC